MYNLLRNNIEGKRLLLDISVSLCLTLFVSLCLSACLSLVVQTLKLSRVVHGKHLSEYDSCLLGEYMAPLTHCRSVINLSSNAWRSYRLTPALPLSRVHTLPLTLTHTPILIDSHPHTHLKVAWSDGFRILPRFIDKYRLTVRTY